MKKVILASSSPRRKELLSSILNDFEIIPSDIDETFPDTLNLLEVPLYISDLKANDIYTKNPSCLVIGCDTAIVFDNKLIGKPKNKLDAKKTLMSFSNNWHYVVTGVTIYCDDKKYQINSTNEVYFKSITEQEIDNYLQHDEYKDKAGSYAIQGIANTFIEKIEGEYEAIIGLPIKQLKPIIDELLK